MRRYCNNIGALEFGVFAKRFKSLTRRAFLLWHSEFYKKQKREYERYCVSLQTRAFCGLLMAVSDLGQKQRIADTRFAQSLMSRVWLALLQRVEMRR